MPFSGGTILQLHSILYRYMPQPGEHWKATNNDIVERHPDGSSRIRFRPVAAHFTPMAMTDLVGRYRTALDQHLADPLVLVPLLILDFLCVHPFPDGNGRLARLLTLQLLYHADYTVGRFISLERIFELKPARTSPWTDSPRVPPTASLALQSAHPPPWPRPRPS